MAEATFLEILHPSFESSFHTIFLSWFEALYNDGHYLLGRCYEKGKIIAMKKER
jgi:hypothetical protein